MLIAARQEETYESTVKKAIEVIERQGFKNIKADIPGYEAPAQLVRQQDQTIFQPDLTATKNGAKSYFEISSKNDDELDMIGKWKLLSQLARIKNGSFQILIPRGELSFTRRMLERHNIEAPMIRMF